MIDTVPLGQGGPPVGRVGYGGMGLEGYYGALEGGGEDALLACLDAGTTLIDTADAYGNGANEQRIGRALGARRDEAFLCSKFGIVWEKGVPFTERPTGWGFQLRLNGSPEHAARSLDATLARLGVDHLDLWYLHYPDPSVPVEESVGAMAEAVAAGKVRHLGLSNFTAEEVRRAHAVHPVAAVQVEYSLWRREAETELLPTLRELGIALVAWGPLGSGFLAGATGEPPEGDFRRFNPRFRGEARAANRDRFAPLAGLADELGATPAQLALAWLLHRGADLVPIPGSRHPERVRENAAAAALRLDDGLLARLEQLAPPGAAAGATLV
jgi:aryl-alcohol dehydrogenase-like predicted oxidoreductase